MFADVILAVLAGKGVEMSSEQLLRSWGFSSADDDFESMTDEEQYDATETTLMMAFGVL